MSYFAGLILVWYKNYVRSYGKYYNSVKHKNWAKLKLKKKRRYGFGWEKEWGQDQCHVLRCDKNQW